jgi:hypothetical protein
MQVSGPGAARRPRSNRRRRCPAAQHRRGRGGIGLELLELAGADAERGVEDQLDQAHLALGVDGVDEGADRLHELHVAEHDRRRRTASGVDRGQPPAQRRVVDHVVVDQGGDVQHLERDRRHDRLLGQPGRAGVEPGRQEQHDRPNALAALVERALDRGQVVRLRAGQPALVRSAVDHHQGVPCFLFAPVDGASRIRVSELQVARVSSAAGLGAAYPVDDPQAEALYAHVLAHRETLLEAHLLEGQSDDVIDGLVLGLLGAIGHVPGWDATRLMARIEERRTRSV